MDNLRPTGPRAGGRGDVDTEDVDTEDVDLKYVSLGLVDPE